MFFCGYALVGGLGEGGYRQKRAKEEVSLEEKGKKGMEGRGGGYNWEPPSPFLEEKFSSQYTTQDLTNK